jgi:murein DD-endopeptidase MepM/ murein hydrolase activator NlpD
VARAETHARARRLTVLAAVAAAPLVVVRLPEPEPTPVEPAAAAADPCAPSTVPADSSSTTSTTTTTTTTTVPGASTPSTVVCPPPGTDVTTSTSTVTSAASSDSSAVPTSTTAAPGPDPADGAPPPAASAPPPPTIAPNLGEPEVIEPPVEGWPVRPITFPVAGPVTYFDDWGACRGGAGCPRHHIGNDIIGMRLQPLLAARDGVVTHLVLNHETAGWGLVITDAEGWDYRYYHVNNDTPGTDDGSDPPEWRLAPGVAEGSLVRAGQVVAYLGDSGNSETSVPHLHFEMHRPDGSPINPYGSLRAAEAAQRCAPDEDPESSSLLPVPPPANATTEVRTRTGRGAFQLGVDGTIWATGDARGTGWDRHAAEDPPCAAASGPSAPVTSIATPWNEPATGIPGR